MEIVHNQCKLFQDEPSPKQAKNNVIEIKDETDYGVPGTCNRSEPVLARNVPANILNGA